MFTDIDGAVVTFHVVTTEIVDPFAAAVVYQTPEPTASLFACHPKEVPISASSCGSRSAA